MREGRNRSLEGALGDYGNCFDYAFEHLGTAGLALANGPEVGLAVVLGKQDHAGKPGSKAEKIAPEQQHHL
jgi:hypothetical protein